MLVKKKSELIFIIIATIVIFLPAFYVLFMISKAGELLNFDYWWMIKNIYSIDGFSANIFDWMFRANEHFVLIPAIIYALNIVVTKGSNIGLCLATFFLAVAQGILLIALVANTLTKYRPILLLLILFISVFNFTPAAAHNWMRGYSGVHWVIANLFVIASIFCVKKLLESQQNRFAIASIILGILGCISYSTALGIWPILCAVAILYKLPKKFTICYLFFSVLVIGIYFLTYTTPSHHPSLSKLNFIDIVTYIPVYLGAIFTHNIPVASAIGWVGLVLAGIFLIYWLFVIYPQDWLPWLSIIIYTFGTALMAAVSRSGFGIEQAIASRYATLPSLFWLSLIILIFLLLQQQQLTLKKQWYFVMPLVAVLTVLTILMYRVGTETFREIAHRATYQPLVGLSLQLGISDPVLIKEKVGNRPAAFLGLVDALKADGLVPFNRNIKKDNFCANLDKKINSDLLTAKPPENLQGYFDTVTEFSSTTARVNGWVSQVKSQKRVCNSEVSSECKTHSRQFKVKSNENVQIKCIAILNQENVVKGFGMSGFPRADVAELLGAEYEFSGWKGYIEVKSQKRVCNSEDTSECKRHSRHSKVKNIENIQDSQQEILTAYVKLKNRQDWIALNNQHNFGF
ncbi:hypothetical protein D5R40_15830 [Okeania hirsuta]|uniref:Glycosyltransferase RgtA/B/C/D-like domain-containing protein n=3 Tax=Okeania TaxID=1458928 RepID=A0A3N6QNT7_9CYAN|nr:hypothetical protein D4Z78_23110 [Okeania hirsuta]RQH40889.1 hypothetical protein D5R40_15830 [Okeania hirsuta]